MFVMVGFHGGFHVSPFQNYLGHINLAGGGVSWFELGIFMYFLYKQVFETQTMDDESPLI